MDQARVGACAADVGRLAEGALEGARPDEGAFVALSLGMERRIALDLGSPGGPAGERPACRRGCAACCTVNVATLPVEGIAVAALLRRRLGPVEAARRARALLAFHDQVRWCDDGDRIRGHLTCPFLDGQGACAVHPVRPLACREVTSLDARECRRALAERAGDEGEGLVRMNLLQRALYGEAREAVAGALARRGLDARSRDVSGMAGVFLADAALVEAYLAGAPVPLT